MIIIIIRRRRRMIIIIIIIMIIVIIVIVILMIIIMIIIIIIRRPLRGHQACEGEVGIHQSTSPSVDQSSPPVHQPINPASTNPPVHKSWSSILLVQCPPGQVIG